VSPTTSGASPLSGSGALGALAPLMPWPGYSPPPSPLGTSSAGLTLLNPSGAGSSSTSGESSSSAAAGTSPSAGAQPGAGGQGASHAAPAARGGAARRGGRAGLTAARRR
jgi:hypothetical protein